MNLPHTWQTVTRVGFDYGNLYSRLVAEAPPGATIVELGVAHGQSGVFLAVEAHNAEKGLRLLLVDIFRHAARKHTLIAPDGHPKAVHHLERSGARNWRVWVSDCQDAAAAVEDGSVWAVFLDAEHTYTATLRQIRAWWPKVQTGGYFAGHDYHRDWPGVPAAVDTLFPKDKIEVLGRCFVVRKTPELSVPPPTIHEYAPGAQPGTL